MKGGLGVGTVRRGFGEAGTRVGRESRGLRWRPVLTCWTRGRDGCWYRWARCMRPGTGRFVLLQPVTTAGF